MGLSSAREVGRGLGMGLAQLERWDLTMMDGGAAPLLTVNQSSWLLFSIGIVHAWLGGQWLQLAPSGPG